MESASQTDKRNDYAPLLPDASLLNPKKGRTGVGGGQLGGVGAVALDDAAQVGQAPDGRAVAAREELQKVALLHVRELRHALPQPPHRLHNNQL